MATTTPKGKGKGQPPRGKSPSPVTKKNRQYSLKDKLAKKTPTQPTITCYAMDSELNFEVYLYTKGSADGFLNNYTLYTEGSLV